MKTVLGMMKTPVALTMQIWKAMLEATLRGPRRCINSRNSNPQSSSSPTSTK